MADEGPTTAGSIVAKLKMDRDQWVADKDQTKVEARELGALNPTIRIDVDTARAMAQIEALRVAAESAGVVNVNRVTPAGPVGPSAATAAKVDSVAAAEARLAAAESASESATQRAIIAEMRLDEVRTKGKQTAVQLAAAEFAASEAVKRSDAAAQKAIIAEEALAEAQSKTAKAALEDAAAQEVNAKATDKAANANRGNLGYMGMVVAAVGILLPMLAPLAGALAANIGAFAGMGAAGVLAVLGIKNAMADGTDAGNTFSAGLHVLKGDLDQLSNTAANEMLAHFQVALSTIDGAMPSLNHEIQIFSGLLGTTGNIVLDTLVSGFKTLLPLFTQAGVYIEQVAVGFQKWTKDGGLASFARMASTALPQVSDAIGALVHGVISLVGALQPLGFVMLGIVTIVGTLASGLTSILGPAFIPVVAGAVGAFVAFKQWSSLGPIIEQIAWKIGLVGLSADAAAGPVGWIVAGIGLLAAAFGSVAVAAQAATAAQQNYTSAVQQDNGVVGKNVQAQAAKALSDADALKNAQHLNISTKLLTDATTGHTTAQEKLKTQIDAVNAKIDAEQLAMTKSGTASAAATREYDANWQALQSLQQAYKDNTVGIKDAIKAYNDIAAAEGLTSISTKAQLQAVQDNANAYRMSVPEYMAAQAAQKQTADQLRVTTQNMYYQNDAAGLLKMALDKLNGVAITAASAQNSFDSSLANSNTHIDATGKTINRATVSLDGMSAAAVANRGELIGQVTAAQTAGEAFRNMTDANGNLINSTEAGRLKLIDMKKQIVDNAVAHGEDRAAVQKFVDAIYTIPASVPAVKFDADTSSAMAKIAALKAQVDSVNAALAAAPAAARTSVGVDVSKLPSKWAPGHAVGGTVDGPGSPTSDSILTRLSKGEEVIRTSAASYDRPFLKAYNANPQKALATVAASGGGSAPINVIVSSKGGIDLLQYVDVQIEQAGQSRKVNLSTGMQKVAY